MNAFSLHILTAFKPFFDGKCLSLVVPTPSGMYGIQAKHSDFVGSIVPGEMKITCEENGEIKVITSAVAEGIVKVEGGENRAQAAYEKALEDSAQQRSVREYYAAQARLARAVNRLKVKRHTIKR